MTSNSTMIRSILLVSQVVQNAISRPPTYHHHQHNERSRAQASNNYANRTAMITSMCTSVAEVHRDQRHHTNGKPQPNNRKESPNNRHHDQHVNQNQNTTTTSQRPSIYHVNMYARLRFHWFVYHRCWYGCNAHSVDCGSYRT